jgi:hypothetical protein
VLFNDTVLYNIAYGGINNPALAPMMDDPEKSEELIR